MNNVNEDNKINSNELNNSVEAGAVIPPPSSHDSSVSTVSSLIADKDNPPNSIESRNLDSAPVVRQESPADSLEELNFKLLELLAATSDIDGDGIPDDWDKNPGETIANVAARINKLGRYAEERGLGKTMPTLRNTLKTVESLFNTISDTSALSSFVEKKHDSKFLKKSNDDDDRNPFKTNEVDKDTK
jgi:hypothetical protein